MKHHLSIEDISAYLDGEHNRPAEVQKHLQLCAECARQHVALQKISAHVRALPEPSISIGFQARVMRAIETPKPAQRASRFWMPLSAALAATFAVVVSVYNAPSPATDFDSIAGSARGAAVVDLAGVLGPDGSDREFLAGSGDLSGDLQLALANETAARPVPNELFGSTDYNESLFALDASEKEALIQLLGSSVIDEQMM